MPSSALWFKNIGEHPKAVQKTQNPGQDKRLSERLISQGFARTGTDQLLQELGVNLSSRT